MKIAISGSSGLIGKHLYSYFKEYGHEVVPLQRYYFRDYGGDLLREALEGCNVVINLAGATIDHRWTEKYMQQIVDSRIDTTRALVAAINNMEIKPDIFISASAGGYYASDGRYTEYRAKKGDNFLADLCGLWEEEAMKVSEDVRCVTTRFGIVLAYDGGVIAKLMPWLKRGVVVRVSGNSTPFTWIHIDDLCRAVDFIIGCNKLSGAVNLCAPEQTSSGLFYSVLKERFNAMTSVRISQALLQIRYGRGAEAITSGQSFYPEELVINGFKFKYPHIDEAVNQISTSILAVQET